MPHVYLPGYHVGGQLRLSLPEVERYVQGRGPIGNYLHHLFTHNPLWPVLGTECSKPHSWVIWEVINIAWMITPSGCPASGSARRAWMRTGTGCRTLRGI